MPSREMVYLNGRYVSGKSASISVFDRGFLLGDAIFETLPVVHGCPFLLRPHFARLRASARALQIPLQYTEKQIDKILRTLASRRGISTGAARITLSRGQYVGGLTISPNARATFAVFLRKFHGYPETCYRKGVAVRTTDIPVFSPATAGLRVKSVNYLNNIIARQVADKHHVHECVMTDGRGHIAECSTANLFFVVGRSIRTPSSGCGHLPGITRDTVIKLAGKAGIRVREASYPPASLKRACEIFITSSLRGIMPVTRLDGKRVGQGKPGEITLALMSQYEAFVGKNTKP